MRKIILIILGIILTINPVRAEDDDSTPYMPYPEQPQQEQKPKNEITTKKKAPAKKTVKKKTPKKKTAPKKAVKKTVPKPNSLQKAIELMQQDRLEQAKPYLVKAIQENRNDPNVWYWYGVWHEKTGGFYQAQYFYSKAVTIDPGFEPLSRVVYYPNDSEKTPLWDPKRPARVYPVETTSKGMTTVSPNARDRKVYPSAPNDPELPKVPVYTPPEPGAVPTDGDSWAPSIYVPPSREEIQTEGELNPSYIPPKVESVRAEIYYIDEEAENSKELERDRIIRADVPLYNPPKPGEKIAQAPKVQTKTETVKRPEKKLEVKRSSTTIPATRVVRQAEKKEQPKTSPQANPAPTKKQTRVRVRTQRQQTVSQDVQPKPRQRQERRQPQPEVTEKPKQETKKEPEIKQPEPKTEQQETPRRQSEYLPPVGQFPSDPGTISEAPMIPPVGQKIQE